MEERREKNINIKKKKKNKKERKKEKSAKAKAYVVFFSSKVKKNPNRGVLSTFTLQWKKKMERSVKN